MANLRDTVMGAFALLLAAQGTGLRADADVGAYLAARQAIIDGNFAASAAYLDTAIAADPTNPDLIESAIAAQVGRGELARAVPLARLMFDSGRSSQLSSMVAMTAEAQAGDWTALLASLDAGRSVSPLVDALARGWAEAGAGDMRAALDTFDDVTETPGMRSFGLYNKALALALAGDFEGADAIFSLPPTEGLQRSRRTIIAHAQILSQLGRGDEALALVDTALPGSTDPTIADLRAHLAAGDPIAWSLVRSPAAGLAEVFFTVAGAIVDEVDDSTVLVHARVASALDPSHVDALFLTAQILERMEQFDLARAAYATVPTDDPTFALAELGRAEAMRRAGQLAPAIEVLTALTRAHPDLAAVQVRLADFLRIDDRPDAALAAYDRALTLIPDADPGRWRILYARATMHFRLDDWDAAERDFVAALELSPDQPSILNFYGYSLVERGERLDEALAMIERAVAVDPDNGAIVDSLGWALFSLGRVDEAVGHLERAAALEPADTVINDHLGDAYWVVGRHREARFQWTRALSFAPEDTDAARIRDKLRLGLDAVLLSEEASLPYDVAGSGG